MSDAESRAYPHVERLVKQRPWAITQEMYAVVCEVLDAHLHGWRPSAEEVEYLNAAAARRPSGYQSGSVAVLPLQGLLVPRASLFSAMSGGTAMSDFCQMLDEAVNDPSVAQIVLDIDSPGGVVDQIPETAARIRAAREQKPVTAVANGMAGSAAYWLACQCSEVCVTPSGEVGSVGVLSGHQDVSGAQAQVGIKTTLVAASQSPHKLDRNPYEPLSPEARADMQAEVDELCGWFIADVARGRRVDPETVASTFGQGRMVGAAQAVERGMADRVETLPQTVTRLLRVQAGGSRAYAAEPTLTTSVSLDGKSLAVVLAEAAAAEGLRLTGPIPVHSTPVVDEPWDAGAVEKALPDDDQAGWKTVYAWFDSNGADPDNDGLPDAKADWKFPHHTKVDGPANVNAVRNGLARLPDSKIPEADKAGVKAHLQRHLDDFNKSKASAPVSGYMELLARPEFREAYSTGRQARKENPQ